MSRVLVVGGGLAGLATALFLKRFAHDVTVVEKSPHLAPLVRGFERRGLRFDTGFHYAGGLGGGVLDSYLSALGLELELVPLPERDGEILRFADTGTDFPVVRGRDAFADAVESTHPGTRPALDAFFAGMAEHMANSPYLNPGCGVFDPARYLYGDESTLAERFDALDAPPRLRQILGFRCLLYGVGPETARFSEFSRVNAPYVDHAATFAGGGAALAGAFDRALARENVRVLTSTEAVSISLDGNGAVSAVGVKTRGAAAPENLPCDMCVYCGCPSALPRLLPEGALRPVYRNRLLSLKQTPVPFIMFASTDSPLLCNRQIFLCPGRDFSAWFPGYEAAGWTLERTAVYANGGEGRGGKFPITAIVCMPGETTAAWRGNGAGGTEDGYREFKQRTAEAVRRRLLAACPEFRGDLEVLETATDVSVRRWSCNSTGAIYGRAHGRGSPPVLPVTRVGGLALAGQNIILPGLLGAVVSAAVATGSLLGHDSVLKVLE